MSAFRWRTPADGGLTKAQAFAQQIAYWQALSNSMPAGSPAVDKSKPAADPIPKATTLAQREARFAAEDPGPRTDVDVLKTMSDEGARCSRHRMSSWTFLRSSRTPPDSNLR